MKRREFVGLLGGAAAWPLAVHAQQPKRTAMAGHLGEAHVRPTLEVIIAESPAHLRKRYDPSSP